ncbi:AIP3-domain-containing protein [Rhizophagus irregularis]|uniref:AIP3-domain-containing protein n=1 Tax=Rhizophagus irregularis TaxID=588596 RepID=A0A2N1NDR1_9GLOM|nr:AIP3-domain-containing protein [Rhizophagus irregularis]
MAYPNIPQVPFPQPNTRIAQTSTNPPTTISPQRRPSSSPTPGREKELSPPPTPQRRSAGNSPMSSIESIVTQLLVTTKLLLEGLTNWSKRRMTDKEVSDIYVKLGNELNTVVHIFRQSGIDMSDLANIPQDLRSCLEKALSEEASPAALEANLPKIRDIIVTLLQGLKAKQASYRQLHGGYDQSPQISIPAPQNMTRSISARSNSTSPKLVTQQSLTPSSNVRRNVSSPSRINAGGSQSSDPMDALKYSDNLERRASKRFSAYTMQRGGHTRARSNLRNQENLKPPSPEPTTPEPTKDYGHEDPEDENNSVSPQPETPLSETQEEKMPTEENLNVEVPSINIEESQHRSLTLFLQLNKDAKKVEYDGDISIPALRMLFIEKFQYNPGLDDFPNIYIKDPYTGVLYELENLSEVINNSVLALNIEALDQVKKHLDQSIANLTKEIREIKKSFSENAEFFRRGSLVNSTTPTTPTLPKHSESQFRDLARMVLTNVKKKKDSLIVKFASDLRGQFDEVQNLRRDLGVMRQFYNEFQSDTKKMIEDLMTQTTTIKNVSLTKIGSTRTFIDAGKAKLDTRTNNLVNKVDELQDIIDELKADVTARRSKPRETTVQYVKKESAAVAEELASLHEYVKTAKPMWKKRWEEELQMIVDEQKFLNHQEELIEDLDDDNKKLTEVFEHITKVVQLQSNSRPKEFIIKQKEEGFEGLKTVLEEVRGISPDHERRIKALEMAEKQRERDLASRIDEFELELTNFVAQNKLKKTGGAEEAERLRQKKNEETLKQLFKAAENTVTEENNAS